VVKILGRNGSHLVGYVTHAVHLGSNSQGGGQSSSSYMCVHLSVDSVHYRSRELGFVRPYCVLCGAEECVSNVTSLSGSD
jgi:hypothetical protein